MIQKPIRVRCSGFSLVELLVVIAVVAVLVGLLIPAVQSAREAARRVQCQSHLRQIGLALSNYHSAYGAFPAASIRPEGYEDNGREKPRSTWAIAILPQMELGYLYNQYKPDEDSTSEANRDLREAAVESYLCPSEIHGDSIFEPLFGAKFTRGNYGANSGSGSWGKRFWKQSRYRGVMGQNTKLSLSHVTDGASQTVAVGEIRIEPDYSDNRGCWAFPAAGSSNIALDCDRQCRGINQNVDDWIPYCGARPVALRCHQQNTEDSNAGPRSLHPSGANLLLCDGSVHFLTDEMDTELLRDLFTSADRGSQ